MNFYRARMERKLTRNDHHARRGSQLNVAILLLLLQKRVWLHGNATHIMWRSYKDAAVIRPQELEVKNCPKYLCVYPRSQGSKRIGNEVLFFSSQSPLGCIISLQSLEF